MSEGVEIHYQLFGQGPPILVLHGGFGVDSHGFETLAEPLSEHHSVVMFDRRGTGRSAMTSPSEDNLSLDLMVADIEAIREHLGYPAWRVLGHSFGGMLASYYTSQHPQRVERLVLSSSSGIDRSLFATDPRGFIQAKLGDEDRAALTEMEAAYEAGDHSEALLDRFSRVLARAYVVNDARSDWVAARLRRADERVGRLITEDMKRMGFDCKPALAMFPRPVLIVHGAQDVFPLAISELARDTFPDARLVVLEDAGHYGWIDRPEAYLELVLAFLRP